MSAATGEPPRHGFAHAVRRLFRLGDATGAELAATLWTGIAFFWVLFAYYLLRPTRETVGSAFGTDLLLGLFTLTFVLITALNQPYLAMVGRVPSSRLVPLALHAFALSFVVLAALFLAVPANLGTVGFDSWLGLGLAFFYSWVTAFSVCGVTLVWVHHVPDHLLFLGEGKVHEGFLCEVFR